jgi:hypothetical protein
MLLVALCSVAIRKSDYVGYSPNDSFELRCRGTVQRRQPQHYYHTTQIENRATSPVATSSLYKLGLLMEVVSQPFHSMNDG